MFQLQNLQEVMQFLRNEIKKPGVHFVFKDVLTRGVIIQRNPPGVSYDGPVFPNFLRTVRHQSIPGYYH